MNYLEQLAKNIKFNGKKQNNKNLKSFWALSVLGVAIGCSVVALCTRNYFREIKNIVINNLDATGDMNEDIYENSENIEDDNNINKNEIKETLEKGGEQSLGDVGIAIENALEDNEDNI